jgi:hypothetical protein
MKRAVVVCAMMLWPLTAQAQRAASPFLPAQHWVHAALRELEMRGAIASESFDAGARSVSVVHAIETFVRAASNPGVNEAVRQRAGSYGVLLRDEYGEDEAARNAWSVRGGAQLDYHDGRVAAGDGYYPEDRTGARPRDDVQAGSARVGVDGRAAAFAFTADGLIGSDSRITQIQGVARLRAVQLWAGRRTLAFGPGTETIVINSDVAFDGAGLALVEPLEVPGFLRGHFNVEGFVARLDQVGRVDNPWFLGARLAYAPHPRFTAALSRGAVFGGDNNSPVTLTNLVRMMIGLYSGDASDFENQIISFDMRYRVPGIPAVLYYEWGMDDGAGAWLDVPAIVAGVTVPIEIGSAPLDITVERASFEESCCGNPIWYRHHRFMGSWASDGVMIGHPLGGEGTEYAATLGAAAPSGSVRGRIRAFTRERGSENVFSLERAGRSKGAELNVVVRAATRLELEMNAGTEHGEGSWNETQLRVGGRVELMRR